MKTLASLLRISLFAALFAVLFWAYATMAQTETGTVSGLITDETGAAVPGAQVQLLNVQRGTTSDGRTNNAGIYLFTGVEPGMYQIKVQKPGFKQVDLLSLIVNVQDHIEQNVRLQVGSISESITVNVDDVHLNTTDATVSTVVDRQFAENLPLNGRSFQSLIALSPGVVVTPVNGFSTGQFSVNGQRASSNYWTVDGVSANVGTTAGQIPSNGFAGAVGATTIQGGTNGLVSVDSLQEFRIQTSTFAPEFGRTPGAQISIVTRSGTNTFHGSLFEYFRNDALDANGWFANKLGLSKPRERQNDFGGTVGGPIWKGHTFFFFSYEGLRLRLPRTVISDVPDIASRQAAIPEMQPILKVFPLPNGGPDTAVGPGVDFFNASFSNRSSIDAYSLRLDHALRKNILAFARYDYAPSSLTSRGDNVKPLSNITSSKMNLQTATLGLTWSLSPRVINDGRFNFSTVRGSGFVSSDDFGGAIPLNPVPLPSPFTTGKGIFTINIFGLQHGGPLFGSLLGNVQRQINVVDNTSVQLGSHALKLGVDYRRLSPTLQSFSYSQFLAFTNLKNAMNGQGLIGLITSGTPVTMLLQNVGIFAEDTWRIKSNLTVTYGLRWDFDLPPSAADAAQPAALTRFNLGDLPSFSLAPPGTPLFHTTHKNVAPRIGLAYQLRQKANSSTVVHGGFGVFYDLATAEIGSLFATNEYPYGSLKFVFGPTFPLSSSVAAPAPISPPGPASALNSADPNLQLPYTLQWNGSIEQGFGKSQTLSLTYVGAVGRRLIQSVAGSAANIQAFNIQTNNATSDYNALQIKFDRKLSNGLQALGSYSWAHSIDTASAGSTGNFSDLVVPGLPFASNRGSSDFDVRHAFSAGLTYQVPQLHSGRLLRNIVGLWSLESLMQGRSGTPVDVIDGKYNSTQTGFNIQVRPDLVPGQPLYLHGSEFPGSRAFDAAAFADVPSDASGSFPLRQGTTPRNFMRGFGAFQWDFAIHRDFSLHENLKLQFRAEMFNILNHPNFGPPNATWFSPVQGSFGQPTQILSESLAGTSGSGGFDALYQIGGPRSIQLALRLTF